MSKMRDGFLLALQFFTIIPYKIEIPFRDEQIRWLVRFLPFIGLISGTLAACQYFYLTQWTSVSTLFLTVWLLFFYVAFSGGIHLDGWMDCSDAYFSYQDQQKRLEIMSDPRVGAFAVLTVFFLLLFRLLFIYETVESSTFHALYLVIIPFMTRLGMGALLLSAPLAKRSGMAFEFKKALSKGDFGFYLVSYVLLIVLSVFLMPNQASFILAMVTIAIVFHLVARRFIQKSFGGTTGDTLGAYVEGKETFLWGVLWLLL
ncbi:adenosylcobinamide-GDP ribazoletransferase [Metabacillus herbersteinensis]|uniref:Adenosylcobinamide-GDP ribazoletransferase n=1 Tax=Metabacillus herbersteinensis TaxID=283816 RepID=A0ABV6GD02_9BACI